jgi:serine/threonine protein kinase
MSHQQKHGQTDGEDSVEAFKREALMLAGLKHEHLPRIYEYFSENECWYLVMDYLEGETLEHRFEKSRNGTLPLVMALQIALQLCSVLEYLHTRQPAIIFRDLKPSNIILTPEGGLFLIDFGIARHFKPGQAKDTIAFGSPGYAAPEQYGKAQTTPRADIYSLGSILHQMLSGDDPSLSPFRYASLKDQAYALRSLITRMLDMDEKVRPASAEEVRQVLQTTKDQLERPLPAPVPATGRPQTQRAGQVIPAMPAVRYLPAVVMPGMMIPVSPATPLQVHKHHYGIVRAVAWSPDSMLVASATEAIIRVWSAQGGQNISSYQEHRGYIRHMAWSPHTMRIASVSEENKIRIWEVKSGQTVMVYPGLASTHSLDWSPDGRLLAVTGGSRVAIWDTDQNKIVKKLQRNMTVFRSLSWSPDGKQLAIAGQQKVLIWRLDAPKRSHILTYRYPGYVNALAWSPDGTYLAYGGNDQTIYTWNIPKGKLVGIYHYHRSAICALSWAPDSRRIVSGSMTEYIHMWDAMTGQNITAYYAHAGTTTSVAWSPNGSFILTGGSDQRVCIWPAP